MDGGVDVSELRYEVMYFVDLVDDRIEEFKESWGEIGDSIVVVGGDGLWNCHVHTNDIGAAIEAALKLDGRPKQIRVTDLFEEMAEEHAAREAAIHGAAHVHSGAGFGLPAVTCAVVAVASGDGLGRAVRATRRAGRGHRRPDAQPVDRRTARRRRGGQRRSGGRACPTTRTSSRSPNSSMR